jgi:hypothetical protein
MEIVMERPYKIVRTMPDGLRLLIGSFADESEEGRKSPRLTNIGPAITRSFSRTSSIELTGSASADVTCITAVALPFP